MAKKNLLLVDQDPKSRRVLEVSLRKAGFIVTTATNGSDALEKVATSPPDLIISDTRMSVMDGFEFCRRLKENPEWTGIPFIFLTNQKNFEDKIRGLELGVEDYLTKPIYIKEIITRVKILLQRKERQDLENKDSKTRFEGTLADMTVVDLIQTVEIGHKTGVLRFEHPDGQQGAIYLRNGQVIDAELGRLQGAPAVYRLLTWSDGRFEVEFRPIHRKQVIEMSPQALLLEGMRRVDEWGRLNEQLPSMDAVFEVDYRELAERLAGLPDEVNSVLKLFDGRRTLLQVLDHSEYDDLEALNIISKLYFEGLIFDATQTSAASQGAESPPLEGWLRDPEAAAAALGQSGTKEGEETRASGGRKRRNTKRGLGAPKEPPPSGFGDGGALDAQIAKEPRMRPQSAGTPKEAVTSSRAQDEPGPAEKPSQSRTVTPAWAATSWSKQRPQPQEAPKKPDLWQDDTKPGVPSRLPAAPGSSEGASDLRQSPLAPQGGVSTGKSAPASKSGSGAPLKPVPPLVFPEKELPDRSGPGVQGTSQGQDGVSTTRASGALDPLSPKAPVQPDRTTEGGRPSVVIDEDLSVTGQARSGEIGRTSESVTGRSAQGGHPRKGAVVLDESLVALSESVSGEISLGGDRSESATREPEPEGTIPASLPTGKPEEGLVVEDEAVAGKSLLEHREAALSHPQADEISHPSQRGTEDSETASGAEEPGEAVSQEPASKEAGPAMVEDGNGAEHGFFGQADTRDDTEDFSDLEWAEEEGAGKRKWILVGFLGLLVAGGLGFWWYSKADRYFMSPDKQLYGDTEDVDRSRPGAMLAPQSRQKPAERIARKNAQARPVEQSRTPARMAVNQRPGPGARPSQPVPSSRPSGASRPGPTPVSSGQAGPSGAAITRALADAKKLLAKRRYKRVIQILESSLPEDLRKQGVAGKMLATAYEKMAQRALDRNALADVVRFGRQAIKADGSRAPSWFFVGYALHEEGKKAESKIYLKQYLTLCPKCEYSRWARRYLK